MTASKTAVASVKARVHSDDYANGETPFEVTGDPEVFGVLSRYLAKSSEL